MQNEKLLEKALQNIENKFIQHTEDFDELKAKQVTSSYVISYATSRLMTAKHILREATRK